MDGGFHRSSKRNERLNFSINEKLTNNIVAEATMIKKTPSEVGSRFRRSINKQTLGPDGRINVLARNNV